MIVRRYLLPLTLLAALLTGCARGQTRRDPAPGLAAAVPSLDRHSPVAAPRPPSPPPLPQPPAEPSVAPPRPETLSGPIPPMPTRGDSGTLAILPTSTALPPQDGEDEGEDAFDPERRRRRRERREERREERQNPPPAPTPQTPQTPSPSPSPPPAPSDRPPLPDSPSSPAPAPVPTPTPAPTPAADPLDEVRRLVDAAIKRYATVKDFEARLVKREVVNGKAMPQEEIFYRFRTEPLSVYMRILSEAGQGREVMYVQGQFGNKMHVATGKGDHPFGIIGHKTEFDPDSRMVTSRSRYRIYEAGLGRTLTGLERSLAAAGKGGVSVKPLGKVTRKEYPYPLEGIEVSTRNTGRDSLIVGGGTRQIFFDANPNSPSYLLPVLVITHDLEGREVEYYCFDRFRLPAGTTDADWNPSRLGKR